MRKIVFLLVATLSVSVFGEQGEPVFDRERAIRLIKDRNYTQALPILQGLAAANQSDREVTYALGVSLLMRAVEFHKPEQRQPMLLNARMVLLRAQKLGEDSEFLDDMIRKLPFDGNDRESEAEKIAIIISLHPPAIFSEIPEKVGIKLLEGYKYRSASNFEGSGGEIFKEGGLHIIYESGYSQGFAADPSKKEKFAWFRKQTINGCLVMFGLVKSGLRTQREPEKPRNTELGNILLVTFAQGGPKSSIATNFQAEILSTEELIDALLMILTYNPSAF
jgi:hypothetical protein